MNQLNQLLSYIKSNILFIMAILLAVILALAIINIFKPDTVSDKKLLELQFNYKIAIKELDNQKRITDSLVSKSNVSMYYIKHDTIVLYKIKQRYEKQKLANRELTPDEQLRFSAEWLSKEDSMEN